MPHHFATIRPQLERKISTVIGGHMKYTCKCSEVFNTFKELRIHIALLTPRWPAQRCTPDHYDPDSQEDRDYVARYVPRNPDRRFT